MKPGQHVFQTLDALRGVAAIGVVILHYQVLFTPISSSNGALAVDLFFIMSGVVIAHAYDGRLSEGMTVARFFAIRCIRLYPLYLASVVLAMAVLVASLLGRGSAGWQPDDLALAFVLALVLLPHPFASSNTHLFPVNFPVWSLFAEVAVNLAYAVLRPVLSTRVLVTVCGVIAPLLLVVALAKGDLDRGTYVEDAWIIPLRVVWGFCAGILIARIMRPDRSRRRLWPFLGLVGLVIVALFLPTEGWFRSVWHFGCVVLLFPAIVYLATSIEPPVSLSGICDFLGRSSYAVYVLHVPLLAVFVAGNGRVSSVPLGAHAPLSGLVMLALLLLLAWCLDAFYDRPVRRYLSNLSKRRTAQA